MSKRHRIELALVVLVAALLITGCLAAFNPTYFGRFVPFW